MSVTMWTFLGGNVDNLTRLPLTFYSRAMDRQTKMWRIGSEPADSREVKIIEVTLEVLRRQVLRAYRVLPVRLPIDADGYFDRDTAWQAAARRIDLHDLGDKADPVARLVADASYFWVLTPLQWAQLAEETGLPVAALRAASFV